MTVLNGPEDIYNELVEESTDNWLLGLVAFAVIEEQCIEWIKHWKDTKGTPPTPVEIEDWYKQQPAGVLLRAKDTAQSRLQDYANDALEEIINEQKDDVKESVIFKVIRDGQKFWPQFGVNVAGGFASTLLFAALLCVIAFFVLHDSSPVEIGKQLRSNIEGK